VTLGVAKRLPWVALGYATALLATNTWLEAADPGFESRVLHAVSTNLHHLATDPWLVLPASAFFTRGGLPFAVAGALLCIAPLERAAGWRTTLLVAVTAHLLGTGVSEGVEAVRLHAHDVPTSVHTILDVGPSYVLVGCAAAAVTWPGAPGWVRWTAGFAVTPLFVFTAWRLPEGRVDAIGHLTAAVVGLAWSARARPGRGSGHGRAERQERWAG
jgi:hypothetical protein